MILNNIFIELCSVTELVGDFGTDNIGVTVDNMRCICTVSSPGYCLPGSVLTEFWNLSKGSRTRSQFSHLDYIKHKNKAMRGVTILLMTGGET